VQLAWKTQPREQGPSAREPGQDLYAGDRIIAKVRAETKIAMGRQETIGWYWTAEDAALGIPEHASDTYGLRAKYEAMDAAVAYVHRYTKR
jgi:hypothetical protein